MALAALLGLVALTGCGRDDADPVEAVVPRVRIAEVVERTPEISSRHLVLLEPWRRAQLSPRYGGQIAELLIEEQDEVADGDLLIRLADADSRGSLMSARASRTSSQKRLSDLQSQLDDARELLAAGAGTRREVERLETEVATTRASIRQASGQIIQSKDRSSANAITAPFAGVITSLEAELGEYAGPGSVLATLSQLDQLAIDVPLSEAELVVQDRGGLEFEVRIRGLETDVELAWVAREADAGTNTFTARLRVGNGDKRLRAGESASVEVRGVVGETVLAIPATAVRWEGSQAFVLRATTEGQGEDARERLERVDITVHEDVDGLVAVAGPLEAGDRVVRAGPATLVDGDEAVAVPDGEGGVDEARAQAQARARAEPKSNAQAKPSE